jgi:large subunit ribosomal protein L23
MSKLLVLKPRLSERTYAQAQTGNVYVFTVAKDATKHTVARAVEAQFDVQVEAVNVANVKGKPKSTISLTGHRRGNVGARSDTKKAYVKLAKGFSLPVFAAVEETEEKEQALQEKADKAMTKQLREQSKKPTVAGKTAGRGLRMFKKQGDK